MVISALLILVFVSLYHILGSIRMNQIRRAASGKPYEC
jgi:hypothetical protein